MLRALLFIGGLLSAVLSAANKSPNVLIPYADGLGCCRPESAIPNPPFDKLAAEDSHNLMSLLRGESERGPRVAHVHNTYRKAWAVRHGRWLLIDAKDGYHTGRNRDWEAVRKYPADDDQAVELYDLEKDLAQKRNLAAEHPQRVAELQGLLKKIRTRGHAAPRLE